MIYYRNIILISTILNEKTIGRDPGRYLKISIVLAAALFNAGCDAAYPSEGYVRRIAPRIGRVSRSRP